LQRWRFMAQRVPLPSLHESVAFVFGGSLAQLWHRLCHFLWLASNPVKWLLPGESLLIQYVAMFRCALTPLCGVLFVGILFLQTAPTADGRNLQAQDTTAISETSGAAAHPVLVELFTSEGCSSCPPADVLLQKMDASQPVGGAQLIVLSEHVDYWDHDGWKDPHSSAALTERQVSYDKALGLKTPYTPQMIVDGTSEVHANNPEQLNKVLQEATFAPKIPVRIGEVKLEGAPAVLGMRIEAEGYSDKRGADVYVAMVLDRVESQVLHGENGGKRLTHVAVVLEIRKIGKLSKSKSFGENVQLKLKPGTDSKNVRIVAFVQEPGFGKVLGAALRRPAN
jgi:hypothetical protein